MLGGEKERERGCHARQPVPRRSFIASQKWQIMNLIRLPTALKSTVTLYIAVAVRKPYPYDREVLVKSYAGYQLNSDPGLGPVPVFFESFSYKGGHLPRSAPAPCLSKIVLSSFRFPNSPPRTSTLGI